MRYIICEKPSVARQFANALQINGKQDGYISGKSPVDNQDYTITWAVGHLVTMSYPEKYDPDLKSWKLSTLPFIPDTWKYELIKDVKKQFDIVNNLFKNFTVGSDIYYNAGDSGREGEYIQRLIVQMSKLPKNADMRRIWIDSQTDAEILRGIKEAKPVSEYDNLSDSAYVRAKEDYLVGINFSRALSCAFGRDFNKAIKSSKYKPLSVGRVMTCVLGMIVRREREIRNFTEQKFYKIEADTGFKSGWKAYKNSEYYNSPLLYSDTGFKNKEDAQKFVYKLASIPKLKVSIIKKSEIKKNAPTLYNLAELQSECSKKLKISPDKTLEIAQSLYEKKLTTYPRTDARVISKAVAIEIERNIKGLSDNVGLFTPEVEYILKNRLHNGIESVKRYVDDSKITDHYAIIPTGEGKISDLNELERKVYDMICYRFLAIFYPPALFNKYEALLMWQNKESFVASCQVLIDYGYRSIYTSADEDSEKTDPELAKALEGINNGDELDAVFKVVEGKTSPPKRYTSGSMVIAMENAGNLIEDEELRNQIKGSGIGTSATRAETITKLIRLGYINLNSKTQVLTPHIDGEAVYDIVERHIPDLLVPETTAHWEQGLDEIAKGESTADFYLPQIENYVRNVVNSVKAQAKEQGAGFEKEEVGICPVCKKKLFTAPFGIACEDRQNKKCSFALGNTIAKRNFTREELLDIIKAFHNGETSKEYKGFISKDNKSFDAMLILNAGEVKFKFPERKLEPTKLLCPKCMMNLQKNGMKLDCSCGFSIWTSAFGRQLSEDELKSLLMGETLYLSGFFSKKKNKYYDAFLKLEGTEYKMSFDN